MHKTFIAQRARVLVLVALMVMAGALLVSGCVTEGKVRAIVDESNTLLISEQLLGPDFLLDGAPTEWQVTAQKIDAFIATHPDQEATNGALRIRQAMLYLKEKQFNLALAAFKTVDPKPLSPRDQALCAVGDTLVWWYKDREGVYWDNIEGKRLKTFDDQISILTKSPAIRDYLAELRMYLVLDAIKNENTEAQAEKAFENGLKDYGKIFTNDDLLAVEKIISQDSLDAESLTLCTNKNCKVSWTEVKRRLEAKTVCKVAAARVRSIRCKKDNHGNEICNNDLIKPKLDLTGDKQLWKIIDDLAKN
ncbi:MAG: hypothetical protein JEZ02_14220 [Desulfatibacillum sp.]|nr:hypothetical protein [Desulfatibacillum sp.]